MSRLSDEAWQDLLYRVASGEDVEIEGRRLPPMPHAQLQIDTVGQAGPGAMGEAWDFASLCLSRFAKSSRFTDRQKVLLDFGTGWARVARCFLRDIPAENIIGVDVDCDLLAVCRYTFPGPRFLQCSPMPPLLMSEASIDFIVGYSVFSHLSEAACRSWIEEFARVLKPGGMAAVTTRGRWFFDYVERLPNTDAYSRALAAMFADFAEAKASYDRGEFVHSNAHGISGGGARTGDFYGETFIPERYAREVLGQSLNLLEFNKEGSQPILFFEK